LVTLEQTPVFDQGLRALPFALFFSLLGASRDEERQRDADGSEKVAHHFDRHYHLLLRHSN
jgi:hypothetical protein